MVKQESVKYDLPQEDILVNPNVLVLNGIDIPTLSEGILTVRPNRLYTPNL